MKKHERIVVQLLDFFKDTQNLAKSIKQASDELGLSYDSVRKAIERYGNLRFHTELYKIRANILAELSARAVGKVAERFENPKSDREFWRAQQELREWHKTLVGTVQRIEQKLEGKIEHEHTVVLEWLKEARERYRRKLSELPPESESHGAE